MQKKIFGCLLTSALVVLFTGYAAAQQKFVAALTSEQVVPPTNSTARGVCRSWVQGYVIQVDCDYQGLSGDLTGWDLALRTSSTEAAFCRFTNGGGSSGSVSGGCGPFFWSSGLRQKRLSIVLKTAAYPNGEIRGKLKSVTIDNDMDGDGLTDPYLIRESDRSLYMYRSSVGDTARHGLLYRDQAFAHWLFMADFDADGRADVSSASLDFLGDSPMFWEYTRSSDNSVVEMPWGRFSLGDRPVYGDYDGDGKVDIAVFRVNEGNWYILQSSDGQMRVDHWGMQGDVAVPGDYDKDGRADLAVVRPELDHLVWYIRRSSDDTYYAVQWGLSTDKTYWYAPVDVDADGASDILVSRDEDGKRVFYALRSSDMSMFVSQWGLTSDKVQFGDFDGDGRTQIAAIRNGDTNRVWFFSPGADGQMKTLVWGLPEDQVQ